MAKKTVQTLHSTRYSELKKLVDANKTYTLEEAVALAKQTANTKFDSSVEVHARLGIDASKGDQQVRATAVLPNGTGKKVRVAVIVSDEKQKEAKDAGATLVGGTELVEEIMKTGKTDFDILITTPDMMKDMAKLAKILGPKGLMPNPKTETVVTNIGKAVKEIAGGKIGFKNDNTGNVHVAVGKASFDAKKIEENVKAFLDVLMKMKPENSKGVFLKTMYLTTTMGPSIKFSI